jgi:hypothetical protein
MDEEPSPSKCLQKSKCVAERQERYEQFDVRVTEAESDANNFC